MMAPPEPANFALAPVDRAAETILVCSVGRLQIAERVS
ncbi:MAG: hypothetical protein CM1200mP2_22410 [Planctomycetaceae bacterium]|nr:MAG: hypothetical protein CM1200mP2_22410 [Planctomycetaceae bacterium]